MQLFMMTAIKMQYLSPPVLPRLRWFEAKALNKLLPITWNIIQQEFSLKGNFLFKEINWVLLDHDDIQKIWLNGISFHSVSWNTQFTLPNQDLNAHNRA